VCGGSSNSDEFLLTGGQQPGQQPARRQLEGVLLDEYIGGVDHHVQLIEQEFLVSGHTIKLWAPDDVDLVMDRYVALGVHACKMGEQLYALAQCIPSFLRMLSLGTLYTQLRC